MEVTLELEIWSSCKRRCQMPPWTVAFGGQRQRISKPSCLISSPCAEDAGSTSPAKSREASRCVSGSCQFVDKRSSDGVQLRRKVRDHVPPSPRYSCRPRNVDLSADPAPRTLPCLQGQGKGSRTNPHRGRTRKLAQGRAGKISGVEAGPSR